MTDTLSILPLSELSQAEKVRDLFLEVYGEGYPVEVYYQPEKLLAINREGDTRSVIAQTGEGDVVAHLAYFPSAPNRRLRELGAGLVSSRLRGQGVMGSMVEAAVKVAQESGDVSVLFGESVCNHTFSQRLLDKLGFVDTALELNLMPAEAYKAEQSATGRVASALSFFPLEERDRELVLPALLASRLESSIAWASSPRQTRIDDSLERPQLEQSELKSHRIAMARLTRIEVVSIGTDLLEALEQESQDDAVTQVYLPLTGSSLTWAVETLGKAGYVYGGYLPQWAATDCLLLQRLKDPVIWSELHLYSDNGKQIADWAKRDLG